MKVNQRTEEAKKVLANALLECLQKKRLEKVTVTEIMDKAGMTRQLFYHYFQDINELAYWTHQRQTLHHTEQFFENKNFIEAFANALTEMYGCKEFYKNIVMSNVHPTFADSFYLEVVKNAKKHIGVGRIDEEIDFALRLYWQGATAMLVDWIKNDMKTDPQILAERFFVNLPEILAKYYD